MKEILIQLQALSMYYQTAHWQVKNVVYYSDHILLQRLYEESSCKIDMIAEKMIGIGMGVESVSLPSILKGVYNIIKDCDYAVKKNVVYFKKANELEDQLCTICDKLMKCEKISEGTKNLIAQLYDDSEGRKYLLNQRIS